MSRKIRHLLPTSLSSGPRRPAPAAPMSKIGMTKLGPRSIATAPAPSDNVGTGSNRTQTYTYITSIPVPGESTPILYNGDRLWANVTLELETAGPVAVGQSSALLPVLSGKGVLLETDQSRTFTIAKGTRLYIASSSVNRVKVTVAPLPWLEQITAFLSQIAESARGLLSR